MNATSIQDYRNPGRGRSRQKISGSHSWGYQLQRRYNDICECLMHQLRADWHFAHTACLCQFADFIVIITPKSDMRFLTERDIVDLLRVKVVRAGSQEAWSKRTGVNRTIVNKVLHSVIPTTKEVLRALKIRTVYVLAGSMSSVTRRRVEMLPRRRSRTSKTK